MPEHPLEHRNLDDRQELLGRLVSERSQSRPLSAYEDDSSHPDVVVVPADLLVVVLPAVVVVVTFGAVVVVLLPLAVVVVDFGGVLEVIVGGTVLAVVGVAADAAAVSTATVIEWLGSGMVAPLGMNATITISPLAVKRTLRRSPVWVVAEPLL
jgi:hypothetical protein